jgi:putative peptide zinc metalloprotease protein
MSDQQRALFSESWHRVAGQRLRLRPSVTIRKQYFRGERWHIAQDGFSNQFFRFRPEAYDIVARLDGTQTMEEIWAGCLERNPDRAPGQGEIVTLLAQLYQANLIVSDLPADTRQLFERHRKRVLQTIKSQVFGVFFLRIPLFDPDALLNRTWPVLRWLFTPAAGVAWLAVVGLGLAAVFGQWDRARDQTQGIIEPGNLFLLYVAFTITKLVHEFGHAACVKKFGGEVHAMGITLLVFTPIPYVDATAAWALRERWKRVAVGLAGMIPELFVAGLAALIWAHTGPGVLNSVCYNAMIVASVSTLVFNLNPLLRFDGYYILSDLTDSPNLQPRSARHLLHLIEHYLFGGQFSTTSVRSLGEAWWLALYGIASWVYRMFVTLSIIFLVADRFFGIGLLAGLVTFIGSFVLPAVAAVKYLLRQPRIERVRQRAWAVSGAFVAAGVLLLAVVPFPRHFRASGVVRAAGSVVVSTPVAGWVKGFDVSSHVPVTAGQPLARLESPELALVIASVRANREQILAREREVLNTLPSAITPMRRRREAVDLQLAQLEHDQAALNLRAPVSGEWVSPRADELKDVWLPRGSPLGDIIGEGKDWEFFAVVPQEYAGELFGGALRGANVRFPGNAGAALPVADWRVVPGRQDVLPSPALGWSAGGPVKVRLDDAQGRHSAEPFFLVVARLERPAPGRDEPQLLWQERTGFIRFDLPWSPLLVQWVRAFRQMLQNRYQI